MSRKISYNGQTFVVPDDATDDEITQIAGGGSSAAPNAGLAPPAGAKNPILNAPEESGLETGPLVSPNPAENDSLTHGAGSARSIARTFHAAGQAMNPLSAATGLWHAATDAPEDAQQSAEETGAGAAGAASGVPAPLARLLYRTVAKPAITATQDYAAGRVSPEAALSVAPEAVGTGGGTVAGGKIMDSLLGAAGAKLKPGAPVNDITKGTYSPAGDHLTSALRSNTKVDVPAEANIAAPAIEEGLNDRGFTTKDFSGRQGPAVLQSGIDNAIDIHEARAKYMVDPIRNVEVDPKILEQSPELRARFTDADGNLKPHITIGDVDNERIQLNKELRTGNFYSKAPSAQYAVQDPLAAAHEAVSQARDLVYDNVQKHTGLDMRPLKLRESALIKLGDLAETTKNTLSPKVAQWNSTSLPSKIKGSVQGLLSVKANPINAFSIPEKVGLTNPAGDFNTHLQKAFPDLNGTARASRAVDFPQKLVAPNGVTPPDVNRQQGLDFGEQPPPDLKLTSPKGKTPPAPDTQEPLEFDGGDVNVPAKATPDILGRGLISQEPLNLTSPGDMPAALQRVLGFENPGIESEAHPGAKPGSAGELSTSVKAAKKSSAKPVSPLATNRTGYGLDFLINAAKAKK